MRGADIAVSILIVLLFLLLSIPYVIQFDHWTESPLMWIAQVAVGAAAAAYITYVFLRNWRRLREGGKEDSR